MKTNTGFLLCIVAFCCLLTIRLSAQEKTFSPGMLPSRAFAPSLSAQPISDNAPRYIIPGKRASLYTSEDWGKVIDSTWGPGQGATAQLQIFDTFWNMIDQQWSGFPNLTLNWDSIRTLYRPQIGSGLSRGRFYALMSRVWMALRELHTYIHDHKVDTTFGVTSWRYRRGVPLLCIGPAFGSLIGAAVTPLPDSTNLVYRVAPGNPLGLEPGDLILGYEGIPWKRLYQQLIDAGLPVSYYYSWPGTTPESAGYALLMSVACNWGLFDTIDIVKYSSGDTLHLSTAPLATFAQTPETRWANDQVPVAGVPMPQGPANGTVAVSWGVIQGEEIGYIYVWDWYTDSTPQLFHDAILDLRYNKGVKGLVLDFRFNWGGTQSAYAGLELLYGFDPTGNLSYATRNNAGNHMGFSIVAGSGGFAPTPDPFVGPIAVLIGPSCFSMGDYVAFLMRFRRDTRFFGKPTNGAFVSSPYVNAFFSDAWHYAFYRGCAYSNVPGEGYLIHKGVQPQEEVWLTREGVARGEDDVVNRAVEWIKTVPVVEAEPRVPFRFALAQNYPNPFNPSTTIKFELPRRSLVSLSVYDVLCRQVSVLVNESRDAGVYEVTFDGSHLASGVYFYRVQAGDLVQSKKLMLLK